MLLEARRQKLQRQIPCEAAIPPGHTGSWNITAIIPDASSVMVSTEQHHPGDIDDRRGVGNVYLSSGERLLNQDMHDVRDASEATQRILAFTAPRSTRKSASSKRKVARTADFSTIAHDSGLRSSAQRRLHRLILTLVRCQESGDISVEMALESSSRIRDALESCVDATTALAAIRPLVAALRSFPSHASLCGVVGVALGKAAIIVNRGDLDASSVSRLSTALSETEAVQAVVNSLTSCVVAESAASATLTSLCAAVTAFSATGLGATAFIAADGLKSILAMLSRDPRLWQLRVPHWLKSLLTMMFLSSSLPCAHLM